MKGYDTTPSVMKQNKVNMEQNAVAIKQTSTTIQEVLVPTKQLKLQIGQKA